MGTGETRPDQDSQLPAEHAPGAPAQYFPTYIEPSPASIEIVVANSTQHIGQIRSDQFRSPIHDLPVDISHMGQIRSYPHILI